MRKCTFWFSLILFIINDVFAQSIIIKQDSLPVYSVINQNFANILDSFVIHEQQYEYYDTTVIFHISMDIYKDCTMIQLFSGNKNNDSIRISINDIKHLLFFYKQHLFIVYIRTQDSEQKLLEETKLKQVVYYVKHITKKNDEIAEFIDDYFPTTWIYQFKDEVFYEKLKTSLRDYRK